MTRPVRKLTGAIGALAALCATCATAETITIVSHTADNSIFEDGTAKGNSSAVIRVGADNAQDAVGLFPFALPEIPEGESILSANIRFHLTHVTNKPAPADAYILPYRSSTTFTIDDFYQGVFGGDPDATALQPNILLIDSPGNQHYSLNSAARETLVEHLKLQYEQGAQPGDYVIFRLNSSTPDQARNYYYNISTANNTEEANRPVLIIETFDGNYPPEVAVTDLQAVEVGQQIEFTVSATDVNEGDTISLSSDDLPDFVSLVDNEDGTATLTAAPITGDAGLHTFTITASDGAKEGTGTVTIVVTDLNASGNMPIFDEIEPLTIKHGTDVVLNVSLTDADSETVTISAINLPPFASFVDNGDLTGTLTLDTWYSDPAGEYKIYFVALDEAANTGVGVLTLTLEAIDFAPGYYIDPLNGDMTNDGSPERPWSTLQAVMAAGTTFQPGDVIYLRDGYHGEPQIKGANADYVFIKPAEGHSPKLSRISFADDASKWHVSGLSISREYAPEFSRNTMLSINGSDNIVSDCEIFTIADISSWADTDWVGKASNGVGMSGTRNTVEGCTIMNVDMGVATGTGSTFQTIRNNHIQNFSGDAVRVLGNDQLVEGNFIADNYNVDDNHDDGIQGWSVAEGQSGTGTGVTARITLRNNTIIECTDFDRPWRGPLQGIGLFDGMFEEWVIENNLILVNQWHGISIYGAINCRIVNNTVLDQNMFATPGPTWITIEPHKRWSGEADTEKRNYYYGRGNVVHNNLTTAIGPALRSRPQVDLKNNLVINETQFKDYIVGYPYDARLKVGSPAIDAGTDEAPDTDVIGNPRPIGSAPDVGAYEWTGTWKGYDVEEGWISTGAFLGQMYVNHAPWLYDLDSGAWFYLDEDSMSEVGAWVFANALVPFSGEAPEGDTWAGYLLEGGWATTPIAHIFPTDGPWAFVLTLGTWCYVPEDAVGATGTWIFASNGEATPE